MQEKTDLQKRCEKFNKLAEELSDVLTDISYLNTRWNRDRLEIVIMRIRSEVDEIPRAKTPEQP